MLAILTVPNLDGAASGARKAAQQAGLAPSGSDLLGNVRAADATVLFASVRVKDDVDCKAVRKACADLKKPILVIPVWATPDAVPPTAKLAGLIRDKGFKVLNIAGSRGSSDPGEPGKPWTGIEAWTFSYCLDLFTLLKELT